MYRVILRTAEDVSELVTNGTQELPALFSGLASVLLGSGKRVLGLLLSSLGAGVRGRKARLLELETTPQSLSDAGCRADHGAGGRRRLVRGGSMEYGDVDDDGRDGDEPTAAYWKKAGPGTGRPATCSCGGSRRLIRPAPTATFAVVFASLSHLHNIAIILASDLRVYPHIYPA